MSISAALQMTQGGKLAFSCYSGGPLNLGSGSTTLSGGNAGWAMVSTPSTGQAVIYSGPGRLNEILYHQFPVCLNQIIFYDSNVVTASGIGFYVSGLYPVLGAIQCPIVASGYTSLTQTNPQIVGVPFFNGLAVQAASGGPGFTVTFTPGLQN